MSKQAFREDLQQRSRMALPENALKEIWDQLKEIKDLLIASPGVEFTVTDRDINGKIKSFKVK